MTLLQLQARVDAARKALASASNASAQNKAMKDLEGALTAKALFEAKLVSKTVKTVKKEERYEEEDEEEEDEEEEAAEDEDEEGEEKAASDDEPKKPMGKKAKAKTKSEAAADDDADDDEGDDDDDDDNGDDDDGEDEDEDEDEEEGEDEDEDARAHALMSARGLLAVAKKSGDKQLLGSARATLAAVQRVAVPQSLEQLRQLKAACQRITGKRNVTAILGALDALAATQKATEKLSSEVAKLKSVQRRTKVDAMLTAARREGKITAQEIAVLRADGIKHGTRWLRAHLDVRPRIVRTSEDRPLEGHATESTQKIFDAQQMTDDQRKVVATLAQQTGKSFDEFVEAMNARRAKAAGIH